ncbi:cell wall protein ecm33 precursor [Lichtheimia corymbifera JMRC:FSU:9682]|uniref:Cell wall protein ecm33 n=1 Tax=Lichtheimia corymbifera JMRC:FSU:9682 TaxID=1263082 RepID=A0A068S050_9FUNG|nr:cell wall protein ecm33 precursor [Lichtheimia corymbifera JMRC:FSU:9682]
MKSSLYAIAAVLTCLALMPTPALGDDCSGDLKVDSQAELAKLQSCKSYAGTITIDSTTAPTLDFAGVSTVEGDIVITDNGQLTQIVFPNLERITGTMRLENNTLLSKIEWPSLNTLDALDVTVQPSLSSISFPAGLSNANKISIADTMAASIDGIVLSHIDTLAVDNNAQLKKLDLRNLSDVSSTICVSANSPRLNLDLSHLQSVQQGSFVDLANITLPNLEKVKGDLSFTDNHFDSLNLPNMTDVSGTLTVAGNNKLEKLSVPELQRLGGALLIANNTRLDAVEAFPKLEQVDGSVDLTGSFRLVDLPKLQNVKGGLNVQTTNDQFSCDSVNHLKGDVIKGHEFVCKSDVDNPESRIDNHGQSNNGSMSHPHSIPLGIILFALITFLSSSL